MTEKLISEEDARYMQMAIDLSIENVRNGGGPFGAVIVRDGKVLATGVNRVTANCDPTAHAEVSAIRAACAAVGDFHLKGATVYSSCEPCPMCLSALYWANVARICYGNTKEDAKAIDFDDQFIYDEIELPYRKRSIKCEQMMGDKAIEAFRMWADKPDKIAY
ncbi:MAG: nucleoside deaminase [Muribaculaceae bacterium]|nr:nucleoside deaminase [Muribaculaceae bacterium]MDE6285721.1 nucleoside deaminase [Muribaculaceae bacterium]